VNPLTEAIDTLGFTSAWTYLALFLVASLLMIWRLEALLEHGLEGTALGTLVMPYCSGLGNLIFVALVAADGAPAKEVLTNCLVNNVTNLTLLLGLLALFWGLSLAPAKKPARSAAKTARKNGAGAPGGADAATTQQLNRLSLLLTLCAVLFFSGATWALGADGRLDASDGLVLVGLFLFWQCFQVFDVLKHNVRQRRGFGPLFYLDLFFVLLCAGVLYASIDWLVSWIGAQRGAFINAQHLGWLTGWLMVLPNALLAFFYAARGRADVAYASQVGDGHICIPLCLGLAALWQPLVLPPFFEVGLGILIGAALLHALFVLLAHGLPRWMGWPLVLAYAWFLAAGLM
jgi:cation:H+ antiporter